MKLRKMMALAVAAAMLCTGLSAFAAEAAFAAAETVAAETVAAEAGADEAAVEEYDSNEAADISERAMANFVAKLEAGNYVIDAADYLKTVVCSPELVYFDYSEDGIEDLVYMTLDGETFEGILGEEEITDVTFLSTDTALKAAENQLPNLWISLTDGNLWEFFYNNIEKPLEFTSYDDYVKMALINMVGYSGAALDLMHEVYMTFDAEDPTTVHFAAVIDDDPVARISFDDLDLTLQFGGTEGLPQIDAWMADPIYPEARTEWNDEDMFFLNSVFMEGYSEDAVPFPDFASYAMLLDQGAFNQNWIFRVTDSHGTESDLEAYIAKLLDEGFVAVEVPVEVPEEKAAEDDGPWLREEEEIVAAEGMMEETGAAEEMMEETEAAEETMEETTAAEEMEPVEGDSEEMEPAEEAATMTVYRRVLREDYNCYTSIYPYYDEEEGFVLEADVYYDNPTYSTLEEINAALTENGFPTMKENDHVSEFMAVDTAKERTESWLYFFQYDTFMNVSFHYDDADEMKAYVQSYEDILRAEGFVQTSVAQDDMMNNVDVFKGRVGSAAVEVVYNPDDTVFVVFRKEHYTPAEEAEQRIADAGFPAVTLEGYESSRDIRMYHNSVRHFEGDMYYTVSLTFATEEEGDAFLTNYVAALDEAGFLETAPGVVGTLKENVYYNEEAGKFVAFDFYPEEKQTLISLEFVSEE